MMARIIVAIWVWLVLGAATAMAQQVLPDHRYLYIRDVDFYGADLGKLFDTTEQACERACSAQAACVGFTFNRRSNSCFPKSAVTERTAYQGAVSALRVNTDPTVMAKAQDRARALGFLSPAQLTAAASYTRDSARRFAVGARTEEDLLAAYDAAVARKDQAAALRWLISAVAVSDRGDLWLRMAQEAMIPPKGEAKDERQRLRNNALSSAVNAFVRADTPAAQAGALEIMAQVLQADNAGRQSIDALRLAVSLHGRADLVTRLETAIAKYGFRITDHHVDNNAAAPRICAEFSEPLVRAGVDYEPFVRTRTRGLVVQVDGRTLCIDGVEHGARYEVTIRAGLPAASGEVLHRDVDLQLYVKDRAPLVRFGGRAFVLPYSADAALPVETVNAGTLDLTLRKISDRNILRAIQQGFFARPLSYWQEQKFSTELAQEIWTGTGDTQNMLNADMTTRLPMGQALAGQTPGIYALTARVPGADVYDDPGATQWFVMTDLGLSTWMGVDGLSVDVRGLGDAAARSGVALSLISRANAVLGRAVTDEQGAARFDAGVTRGRGAAAPALLIAQAGEGDFAFLPLTDPAFDLSDRGVEGRPPAPPIDSFLATDRGAYRVGDTVQMTALLRDPQMRGLAGVPLTALLFRPDGVEYSRHQSTGDMAGGHVFSAPLGMDVPRGTWRVELRSDIDAPALVSRAILVEDFLPERLDFTLDVPSLVGAGDTPPLTIKARYLFGAAAADLPVQGDVRVQTVRHLAAWPGYVFGSYDTPAVRQSSTLPHRQTDASGKAVIPVSLPEMENAGFPLEAEVVVRVSEGSGRPVERRLTFPVATAQSLIGIRKGFDDALPEGGDATFDVIALAPNGMPMAAQVRWTLNKVHTRYQWYQLGGNWEWERVTRRERVAQGDLRLGNAPVPLSAATEWGRYELVVERVGGDFAAASVTFDSGWYGADDGTATPDRLDLSLDATEYAPGDTATVRLMAPADGVALVSVLSNRVVERRTIAVREGENTLSLTVSDDWGTGVYVTAAALRPMDVAAGQLPGRALGVAHAAVRPGAKMLGVAIVAPDAVDGQAGPLSVQVKVDGIAAGEMAWVTLAAVDEGILNLTGFDAPDPTGHYFGQRRLGVEMRDIYGRLIDGLNGAMGAVRSGGDAAAELRAQAAPPTEQLMAQFSGAVQVGADGIAHVDIMRPSFNGTIRLMAVAWSQTAVGDATRDVLARDPVVVTASLPRFLAPGDQSRLLLEFVHATGSAGEMALQVTGSGVTLGAVPAVIALPQGGARRLEIPLSAGLTGDHQITVALTTPEGAILRKTLALGVRDNDPAVAKTRRFTLDPGRAFTFDREILAGLRPATATATLSAGPLARFDVPGLLQRLDRYPYGCTEQVASAALPLLYLGDIAMAAGLGEPERLQARIDAAIARVLTRQSSTGAFGMWRAGSGEFWLDAYVTDFLSQARAQGHGVPELAFSLAMDNLRNRINYAPDFDQGGEDIAYGLMVLAREGAAAMGDLRYYADTKAGDFGTALAVAQLGTALALYGDQLRADRMFARAGGMLAAQQDRQQEPTWRADFGTPLRDVAGVLRLAAETGSTAVDQAALARKIGRIAAGLSTQEAAQIALAAHALRASDAATGIEVDGKATRGPVIRYLDRDSGTTLLRNSADSPIDITITSFGVPDVEPEADGYGFALQREIFTMTGQPAPDQLRAGDRMVVVLTVSAFEKIGARLIVDDPLPAGFEIDNPNLLRSGDIKELDWLDPKIAAHAEFRAERFVAAVDHRGADSFQLAYVVRAVTPGRYRHPAATVQDMYRPEYQARTATSQVVVLP